MREKESIRELRGYELNYVNCKVKFDVNEGSKRLFKYFIKEILDSDIDLNLYFEDFYSDLKEFIIDYINIFGVNKKNFLVGNGLSEIIDLIIYIFVDKDEVILSFFLSFSMYFIYS